MYHELSRSRGQRSRSQRYSLRRVNKVVETWKKGKKNSKKLRTPVNHQCIFKIITTITYAEEREVVHTKTQMASQTLAEM